MLRYTRFVAFILVIAATPGFAADTGDACTISLQGLAKLAQTAHVAAALAANAAAKLDETKAIYDQCRLRPHDRRYAKSCQSITTRLKEAERTSEAAEDELDSALDEVDSAYDEVAVACEGGPDEGSGPVFTALHQDHRARRSASGASGMRSTAFGRRAHTRNAGHRNARPL